MVPRLLPIIWGATPVSKLMRLSSRSPEALRADARRNRERLLQAAREVVAEQGADASLEEIARRAGVGSATLHRHFESRHALLEEIFGERVQELCDEAAQLADRLAPGPALIAWLRAIVVHALTSRGLAAAIGEQPGPAGEKRSASVRKNSAHATILSAGQELLSRAQASGEIDPDLAIADLLRLTYAIAVAVEPGVDPISKSEVLLQIVVNGIARNAERT